MRKIPSDMVAGSIFETERTGKLKIIKYTKQKDILIEFLETGTRIIAGSSEIRAGKIKDRNYPTVEGVGSIGYGKHKPGGIKNRNRAYVCWHGMISRCYSPASLKRNPCYTGVTVCDLWLGFQNFAGWYYDNYPQDGNCYHLDKDLKILGNKVYGPGACKFVTREENCNYTNVKNYTFKDPSGTVVNIKNLNEFCKNNGLVGTIMSAVHNGKRRQHKGWTKA